MGLDIFSALSVFRNLNTIFLLDIERIQRVYFFLFLFFLFEKHASKINFVKIYTVVNGFRYIYIYICFLYSAMIPVEVDYYRIISL